MLGRLAPIFTSLAVVASAALLTSSPSSAEDPAPVPELDQDWSKKQRVDWYEATQGSRLIPRSWLFALEQPGSTEPFLAHIASFGYLPRNSKPSLPVGFAIDVQRDDAFLRTGLRWKPGQGRNEAWVGLTCSACHTTELAYQGKRMRIDGGPAMTDFQSMMENLNSALQQTRDDPAKWKRFAEAVLDREQISTRDDNRLRAAFKQLLDWQLREAEANRTSVRYGPGRVDAFGRIYNKIALLLDPSNTGNPPDAPVSIPFIWRAPQLKAVQYNGIAPKVQVLGQTADVGALGRNTGEVIGVFADVVPVRDPGITNGFISSVHVRNLSGLEDQLAKLRPPKWPAAFFGEVTTDPNAIAARKVQVDNGKRLFKDHRCAECHEPISRTNLTLQIAPEMSLFNEAGRHSRTGNKLPAPGTDPWMACNAFDYSSPSGILDGLTNDLLTETGVIG